VVRIRRIVPAPFCPGAFGARVGQSVEAPVREFALDPRTQPDVARDAGQRPDVPADCPMGHVLTALRTWCQADWTPIKGAIADLGDEFRLDRLHVLCGAMPDVEPPPNILLRLDP
jgi:hypothetical protein